MFVKTSHGAGFPPKASQKLRATYYVFPCVQLKSGSSEFPICSFNTTLPIQVVVAVLMSHTKKLITVSE